MLYVKDKIICYEDLIVMGDINAEYLLVSGNLIVSGKMNVKEIDIEGSLICSDGEQFENLNVDGEIINQLKQLPKGGIKGLMYYKVAIAQKKKINITADVSLEEKSILHKLNEKDIRIICKLIGIYLDNAIEAAEETRKKRLSIEIYELRDKACFVFSNTFKQSANFADRNKKGITTKGEGHGNGLYFASKLIQNNDWLESKQEIIDKYYVQQLIIHKLPHKKEAKEKSQK